jgi:predicted RNA-binding Zn-ribbon protein involved in translation (DUF1610 family)
MELRPASGDYVSFFASCPKCGASMGQVVAIREYYKPSHCEHCKRIQAWLPEIVAEVAKALKAERG